MLDKHQVLTCYAFKNRPLLLINFRLIRAFKQNDFHLPRPHTNHNQEHLSHNSFISAIGLTYNIRQYSIPGLECLINDLLPLQLQIQNILFLALSLLSDDEDLMRTGYEIEFGVEA